MSALVPAIVSLAAILAMFTAIWWLSFVRSDAGIVDLFWSPGFVLLGLVEVSLTFPPTNAGWLMLGLVTLWSARLAVHLGRRHRLSSTEDARYAAMRAAGGPDWPRESLWRVFWVQAVALWAIATPIHAALIPGGMAFATPLAVLGGALFFIGFGLEAIADRQLARFKAQIGNQGRLCTDGVFALCRHPNYLGEIILWWGLGLLALGLTGRVWALIGPALLTFFIVKVSGVPPLETVLSKRPGFADWASRTPALWPRLRQGP
jgi:steroid 5-alpha reductase family enzyme